MWYILLSSDENKTWFARKHFEDASAVVKHLLQSGVKEEDIIILSAFNEECVLDVCSFLRGGY